MTDNDETVERVIETLKQPVTIDSSLNTRVMSEIEKLPAHKATAALTPSSWFARRWTIRVSPLGGLAAAATLAAIALSMVLLARGRETASPTQPQAITAPSDPEVTQFVLVAPGAKSVALVGDFNDWSTSATRLVRQAGDGVWWVNIQLPPGRYRYAFIVDGDDWQSDPNAPAAEDEFGRANSVITIGGA